MMTREECIRRYGAIDFQSKIWRDRDRWMQTLEIDSIVFRNFYIAGTKVLVHKIYVNIDMMAPLHRVFMDIERQGLEHLLTSFDGVYNIRMTRGSTTHFSAHSYGLAIDLNAKDNPLGATTGGFYNHPELVKCFTEEGFRWGGTFRSRKDPMHFSWAGF